MRRVLGALLVSLVALAACDDDGGADDAAETTTTASEEVTTTAPTTTTSTTEPVPFDVEVRRAAIELLEIRNEVFMAPDVSRVDEYIADTCVCLERERGFIEGFVRDDVHWDGPVVEVRGIAVDNNDQDDPLLTLVARQPEARLVGSDGSTVRSVSQGEAVGYRVGLAQQPHGGWRINLLDGLELNDGTISEILEAGRP
jgi:hypothetical protein